MIDCKFYIIHNLEEDRYNNVMHLLEKNNIPTSKIEFINHPNKNELTIDIKRKAVQKNAKIKDGWISCSYKHYLALEKIVHGSEEFGVIMEDNIGSFYENIYERLSKYLDELPKDWEILYDSVWGDYSLLDEEVVTTEKLVYKKSNEVSKDINGKIISHGGTRAAQFYFVNKVGAKKLYDNFLPFNHSADMWMNDVLRKANINSFWSEPSLVVSKFNSKTSTNLSLKNNLLYILKSKFHNYRLGI